MKIAIIGAGACGLMLATLLEKNNIEYTIFNSGKIGNKILASGNGRCNISNSFYDNKYYHKNKLAESVVKLNQAKLFDYLRELKIYTKADNEGRMYPISESSLSVLNVLLGKINTKIIECEVGFINKNKNQYYIDSYGPYDKVVVATGSNASYKKSFKKININNYDIKYNEFKPSLVGFKTTLNIKCISGVRTKCRVSLQNDNDIIHTEDGEVIFKDNGISGICIMNLSSYYNHLDTYNKPRILIDLSPDADYDDYSTVLHPKLLKYIIDNNINIHHFEIPIVTTYEMEFAQVACGGINISELNSNLSLKKDNNIYAGGEVVDVDGICGGYNLMFAFCSSLVICEALKNEISNR